MPSPRSFRLPGIVVALITILATFLVVPGRAGAVTAANRLRITTQ